MSSFPVLAPKSSTYSDSAPNYRENGIAVIPCKPRAKVPGQFHKVHGWYVMDEWQRFCTRQPTRFETPHWDTWTDAGICAPLGPSSGVNGLHLVAIDIDTDEPAEVAAIKSVLPGSPCVKRGAKGETQFYLASPAVKNRPFNDGNKRRMLDLLANGRQTVMPPTAHPDCPHCGARSTVGADLSCTECGAEGRAYHWLTPDTLADFDVADLPVLPDDIADRLAEALQSFGYEDRPALADRGSASLDGDNYWRSLNDAALANLSAWVPALGLFKCRQVGGKYKAVATWRPSSSGRPDSERATNLAISSEGIKDCGEDKGYTPIDLVMAAFSADVDVATAWLQDRVAPIKPIVLSAKPPERKHERGNLVGLTLAASNGERVEAAPVPVPDEDQNRPLDLWQNYEAPELPRGLLPSTIESFAFAHGAHMGVDPAGLAMSALAACASAITDDIKLQVKRHDESWTESARLWVALVGPPSTKKTPILSAAPPR